MEAQKQVYVEYIESLERRLRERSDQLEELHMEAAIDAQLTQTTQENEDQRVIFDDYVNPHSVSNCLSPYVPTKSLSIASFLQFVELRHDDVLLDIGCGDGRVCLAAARLFSVRKAYGVDVSPLCIRMANEVAAEERVSDRVEFIQADATQPPDQLFQGTSMLQFPFPLLLPLTSSRVNFALTRTNIQYIQKIQL
jgi:tRNA G46 methylase TrmB